MIASTRIPPLRILVTEYFCAGGGGARLPRGLLVEARAILQAALEDFGALRGARVLTLRRPGLALGLPAPHEARAVRPGGLAAAFRRALEEADAALVVAPERDAVLLRLTRIVERAGVLNLGCASGAVRIASDKWLTHRALVRAGVAQPRTALLSARSGRARLWTGERALRRPAAGWIVKPLDGYACMGLRAVPPGGDLRAAARAAARHTRRRRLLLQERLFGIDASVSLVGDGERAIPLVLNGQRLARTERAGRAEAFEYAGGFAPLPHPHARAALRAAARAAEAIPGLRGYFGADLVLGRQGPAVVDVNPRLTTSYLLLRRLAGENPARWILDAAARRRLPAQAPLRRRAEISIRCPTSSAGTSAAST